MIRERVTAFANIAFSLTSGTVRSRIDLGAA
nr:MAG TPA: hypothetical protein [Caudoviricetes sp.]